MKPKRQSIARQRAILGAGFLFLFLAGIVVYFAHQHQESERADHPRLTHYVETGGDLINGADAVALEELLASLDKSGRAQVVIVARRWLDRDITEEALDYGRRYGIGHPGRNDGVVLMLSASDRKARIEVGYGLEGVLTDALSRILIAEAIEPALRAGDLSTAARLGAERLVSILHPEPFSQPDIEQLGIGWLVGVGFFMLIAALVVLGVIQALILSIPPLRRRIAASKHWSWFARIHILGGGGTDSRGPEDSGSGGVTGGGSFGGGGANN
jgi:uncharacterized protein